MFEGAMKPGVKSIEGPIQGMPQSIEPIED
jgi:hypothetical protein